MVKMVNNKSKEKEKESDRDLNDKKRRKSDMPKEDVYSSVVKFEEQESQDRSAEKDSKLFHSTCSDLRKIFEQITELKKSNTEKARQEINEKRIEASFLFVVLKKLNRLDKVRLRTGRDDLHNEKQCVDSNRLQLQNLFYEAEHLNKEVQRCLQFKSQDEEIDLISEEEFRAQVKLQGEPETIAKLEKTSNDDHARRLARLEWELKQRKELAAMCKELEKQKELVAQDNEMKTNLRDSLKPRLDALLKSTRPLQEALNMNFEEDWKVQTIAHLLPRPLYLVYANLCAYSEACDNLLSTSINGDEFDAKNVEEIDKFNSKDDLDDAMQDSDNEDNDGENDRPSKGHHRRKNMDGLIEQKKDNLFKAHPLSVSLRIKTKSNDNVLCLTLYYLPALNFVTAQCKLEPENLAGSSEVLNPTTILNALNPNDYGEESVNPKTFYQLKELSIDPADFLSILNEKMLGKPYRWAQDLCGLEFLTTVSATTSTDRNYSSVSNEVVQLFVPKVVKQIRSRWLARLGLHNQITMLENKNFNSTSMDQQPIRLVSNFLQWTNITWDEYRSSPATKKFVDGNVISSHDLLYRAVITRGSAKLECFVGISANYPTEMPLCALELSWNGRHNADSNAAIKDMEAWVNSIDDPKNVSHLLEMQIKRALASLDIYLETEATLVNSSEFPPSKSFLKAFRDRTHSRPYKLVDNSDSVVYTQI